MFELVGLLAKYFGGALPIADQMKMTRRGLLFWYRIYERQVTEEEIVNELLNPKAEKTRLPGPADMRRRVDARIEERRRKLNMRH